MAKPFHPIKCLLAAFQTTEVEDIENKVPMPSNCPNDLVTSLKKRRKHNILVPHYKVFRIILLLLGFVPNIYDKKKRKFIVKWRSFTGIHCILTAIWITTVSVTTCLGLYTISEAHPNSEKFPPETRNYFEQRKKTAVIEHMGVIIVIGCVINAWIQIFSMIWYSQKICTLMNLWHDFAIKHAIDPTPGVKKATHIHAGVIFLFMVWVVATIFVGRPKIIVYVFDCLAHVILMVPVNWLITSRVTIMVSF